MAYELRISDWSSDVCSSDLGRIIALGLERANERFGEAECGKRHGKLSIIAGLARRWRTRGGGRNDTPRDMGSPKNRPRRSLNPKGTQSRCMTPRWRPCGCCAAKSQAILRAVTGS